MGWMGWAGCGEWGKDMWMGWCVVAHCGGVAACWRVLHMHVPAQKKRPVGGVPTGLCMVAKLYA